jgi:YidC/Oxa1 family membrane protein insertase
LKRLQAKYKNDRQKLNEEMMKFYKENNINPLAGCLPLILQMPLFIVLYRLILELTHTVIVLSLTATAGLAITIAPAPNSTLPTTAQLTNVAVHGGTVERCAQPNRNCVVTGARLTADVQVEGKIAGHLDNAHTYLTHGKIHGGTATTVETPANILDPTDKIVIGTVKDGTVAGADHIAKPKHVPAKSKLATALDKHPGQMVSWGIDLAKKASGVKGLGSALPFYVLVLLTVLTGYYQQRQMTSRTPADAQNQQAQMMGKIFPLFFGFISLNIPAGVVVYFIVSNTWQIGQQALIFRSLDAANPPPAAGPKGGGGSGGGAPKGQAGPGGGKGGGTPAKPKPKPSTGSGGNGRGSPNNSRRSRARRGR